MMFAKTEDFNIFYNNHLIMVFVEYGIVYDVPNILLITFSEEQHCLRISCRRV